jgi:hypothetical protein
MNISPNLAATVPRTRQRTVNFAKVVQILLSSKHQDMLDVRNVLESLCSVNSEVRSVIIHHNTYWKVRFTTQMRLVGNDRSYFTDDKFFGLVQLAFDPKRDDPSQPSPASLFEGTWWYERFVATFVAETCGKCNGWLIIPSYDAKHQTYTSAVVHCAYCKRVTRIKKAPKGPEECSHKFSCAGIATQRLRNAFGKMTMCSGSVCSTFGDRWFLSGKAGAGFVIPVCGGCKREHSGDYVQCAYCLKCKGPCQMSVSERNAYNQRMRSVYNDAVAESLSHIPCANMLCGACDDERFQQDEATKRCCAKCFYLANPSVGGRRSSGKKRKISE